MIVFLDFDGTTHPYPCEDAKLFAFLPRIESVIREFAAVRIVIASDWRRYHPLSELKLRFASDMRARVIGVTPSLTNFPTYGYGVRRREATAYMQEHDLDIDAWVALDDYADNWSPIDERVIVCPNGFYDREEQLLRAVLSTAAS